MTSRGAAVFLGSCIATAVIWAVFGSAAAYFYLAGIIVGPSVYLHRLPWHL